MRAKHRKSQERRGFPFSFSIQLTHRATPLRVKPLSTPIIRVSISISSEEYPRRLIVSIHRNNSDQRIGPDVYVPEHLTSVCSMTEGESPSFISYFFSPFISILPGLDSAPLVIFALLHFHHTYVVAHQILMLPACLSILDLVFLCVCLAD